MGAAPVSQSPRPASNPQPAPRPGEPCMQPSEVRPRLERMIQEIETVIVGKRGVVEGALIALLAAGHLLIEDVPGTGKTMLARSIARTIDGIFRRIQFTPDLLPADIT